MESSSSSLSAEPEKFRQIFSKLLFDKFPQDSEEQLHLPVMFIQFDDLFRRKV